MQIRNFIIGTFLVFLLSISAPLSGQEGSGLFKETPVYASAPHFGLQAGTMFSSGFGGGSMFTHSLAPSFNWDISRRFNIGFGTIFSSSSMNGMNAFFPYMPHMAGGESMSLFQNQRLFSTSLYVSGAYQVNPRLTLIGTTWMERNNLQEMGINPDAFSTNPRGMMFGFDYRVTENFSFGAEINISSGYNPFNPLVGRNFYGPGFHSPSPFHRNSRW